MRTCLFFFIQLASSFWHCHHRHVLRHHSITSLSRGASEAPSLDLQSSGVSGFSEHSILVDDLRKSKPLYQFILTFPERARKELSFSLFVEHDFAAFLFGVLRFNRRARWPSFPADLRSVIYQYIEVDILNTSDEQVTRYVDILWCLGKLSVEFSSLPSTLQNAIQGKLTTLNPSLVGREVSRVLYSMSMMQARWADIPTSARGSLIQLLATHLSTMNVVEVVNSVYALGRMGCRWSTSLPAPLFSELLIHVQRSVQNSGSVSISNLLWGMSKSGLQWSELPPTLRSDLINKLVSLSPLPAQTLSSCLSSLHRLGAVWSDMPVTLRHAVEESLSSLEGSSEQAVANVLWALGSMEAQLVNFERAADVLSCLDRSVLRVCTSFTTQGLSNCLLGLAKLGVQQRDLSPQTWSALQEACCNPARQSALSHMDPRAVSNVVWSLGVMHARWSPNAIDARLSRDNSRNSALMCADMSDCVLAAVDRAVSAMTEQGLSMTLLGLAKMKLSALDLNSRTRQKLLSAIVSTSDSMTGQGISNCLWSLHGLGFVWRLDGDSTMCVPDDVQHSLLKALVREASRLPPPSVSLCWNSFAKLGCVNQDLPPAVLGVLESSLESTCAAMSVRELSNAIYGLGKMNRQFQDMPSRVQLALLKGLQRALPDMDEQEVGIALWGLGGQMGLSYRLMPPKLQALFSDRISYLRPQLTCQSLTALFQGLSKVGDISWQEVPIKLRTTLLEALETVLANDTDAQDLEILQSEKLKLVGNVMYSAGRLQLNWESELKPVVREQILSTLAGVNFRRGSEQQLEPVLHAVNGMAKLKLTWAQLGSGVRTVILDSLIVLAQLVLKSRQTTEGKSAEQFFSHGANRCANLLWSLAQLNVQWAEDIVPYPTHTKYLFACLVKLFPHMSGYEYAWSLWSMAKWSVPFADLPQPLQKTIIACAEKHVPRATGQELGVMLWAFIRIKAPIAQFPPALTAQIVAGVDSLAT